MKKVALIGSHGIRKTTHCHGLVACLKKSGVNAEYLPEFSRYSPFPINESTTEESQRWILYKQLLSETESLLLKPEVLVCDRGVIDNYAYFVRAFGRRPALDPLIHEQSRAYDAIFKVPLLGQPIEDDGVRSTDQKFQQEIDLIVDSLLQDFSIPFINFTSPEDSCRYILDEILKKS